MSGFEREVTEYFLEHQLQLFPETVAETPEEAEEVFALPDGRYLIVEA